MSRLLPRLRNDLEVMPSPVRDRPGLLIRDPYRFSDATLIVPPLLARCLGCFDGQQTELELHEQLVRITGQLVVAELAAQMIAALGEAGFLDDAVFAGMREKRLRAFEETPHRSAAHAGGGYPLQREPLRQALDRSIATGSATASESASPPRRPLIGIAAPHVSPDGGVASYGAAYGTLSPDLKDRTFVILGTSHYGEPERFGLTRKPFATPFGRTRTDVALVDGLIAKARAAVKVEDYCHAIEHSIEFQVVYLQHLFGPDVRIVPILCGAFATRAHGRVRPEQSPEVARFIDVLAELAERESERLFWVMGVDMAHVGVRYGDDFAARAGEGALRAVAAQDRQRIDTITRGDADGFWERVCSGADGEDQLKWCGSAPLYTFLRARPGAAGELLHYHQWNIDESSVVSFAGLSFHA
ncbi:MAG TPA: AmmeMemoRadiSam system protein B [Polyangia bacterium]|jgi:AmmeMemoRadiSam system protein B|nr:AmmeMemoRadiSam system protein B [Polyangia bacterium]